MNATLSPSRGHYITRVGVFLTTVALIAGMIGCAFDTDTTPPVQYNLTVADAEGGSVAIPGQGTFTYDAGTVATLVATPASGYRFVSWTGNVDTIANPNTASTTITMNGNYSIRPSFYEEEAAVTYYTLTIAVTGSGSTSPAVGQHSYAAGTEVPISATPAGGWHFVNWTGDTATIGNVNSPSTTITMHGNYSITANFEEGDGVVFPDSNLEAAIREAIGKPTGPIYESDLQGLTSLSATHQSISDLTGLEYFINLTWLNLAHNRISDISPLTHLTSLAWLALSHNGISDISPLANLTKLTHLFLHSNQISNIEPLQSLTNLTRLFLFSNQISSISPLINLTNLTRLYLHNNQISSISPLANLTSLTWLYLHNNQINDISFLANLTNLTQLALSYNEISDIPSLSKLTILTYL